MKIAIEHFLTKQNINDDLFYSSLISELEEIIEEEPKKKGAYEVDAIKQHKARPC